MTSSPYKEPYHRRHSFYCDTCQRQTWLLEADETGQEPEEPTCEECGTPYSRLELDGLEPSGRDECGEQRYTLRDLREAWGGRNGGDGDED